MSRGRDVDRSGRAGRGTGADRLLDWRDLSVLPSGRVADEARDRNLERRRPQFGMDRLDLPRGQPLQRIDGRDRTYRIRGSETEVLATVGAFRVVREDDLAADRSAAHVRRDVDHLKDQGLVERRSIAINRELTRIVALTRAGQYLLHDHRTSEPGTRDQVYHSSWGHRSDLPHDAQLYRVFQLAAREIEADGGRVSRVVLDAELRGDYISYLERGDRPGTMPGADRDHRIEMFSRASELPVIDGRVRFPDLRIEYELEDRLEHRDLELATEHYSRSHLATRVDSGFTIYRAVVHAPTRQRSF